MLPAPIRQRPHLEMRNHLNQDVRIRAWYVPSTHTLVVSLHQKQDEAKELLARRERTMIKIRSPSKAALEVSVSCRKCGSFDLKRNGVKKRKRTGVCIQQYRCKACGHYFIV